jgi:hypothetical protein
MIASFMTLKVKLILEGLNHQTEEKQIVKICKPDFYIWFFEFVAINIKG